MGREKVTGISFNPGRFVETQDRVLEQGHSFVRRLRHAYVISPKLSSRIGKPDPVGLADANFCQCFDQRFLAPPSLRSQIAGCIGFSQSDFLAQKFHIEKAKNMPPS
jgi:hypothetical protein